MGKKNLRMDYKTLTLLLKNEHISLEECAELYNMTPEEFEVKVRGTFAKRSANQLIRELKNNKPKKNLERGFEVTETVVETEREKATQAETMAETTTETTAETTTETTTETTEETLEQMQTKLSEKRQLLYSLEVELKKYAADNNLITKKLADAKRALEKVLTELRKAQRETETLLNSLESNQQQCVITKGMIQETREEIKQLEENISNMCFIRVACGNVSATVTAEESQFEIPESSVKAKLMVLFDEPFMATLSIEQAKAVARYLVLVEAVKSSWGKEVKLIFSDESSCVAILLSEHFGIATEVI